MPVDPEELRKARDTYERQSVFWRTEADRYANLAAGTDDAQARDEARMQAERDALAQAEEARRLQAARAAEIDFELARSRIERGRGRNATRDL